VKTADRTCQIVALRVILAAPDDLPVVDELPVADEEGLDVLCVPEPDTTVRFTSDCTKDQEAAWLILSFPARYGRKEIFPLLDSCTNDVILAKYVECGSLIAGAASDCVVFVCADIYDETRGKFDYFITENVPPHLQRMLQSHHQG
jgi:hypothetical protein